MARRGGVPRPNAPAVRAVGGGRRRGKLAEPVQRLGRRERRPSACSPAATPTESATSRRSISTNRPDSGRFDQSALAVTWNSTIRPAPRAAWVTSGVPSASRAQVASVRSRARLGQHLAGHPHLVRHGQAGERRGGGKAASPAGWLHDIAPPSWRSPASSFTGSSASGMLGQMRAGEAHQQPALAHPAGQRVAAPAPSATAGSARISTDRSRDEQCVQVALAQFGDRVPAPGAGSRAARSAACRRWRRRRPAGPTGRRRQRSSSSTHRAGRGRAFQHQPAEPVAQFRRQADRRLGLPACAAKLAVARARVRPSPDCASTATSAAKRAAPGRCGPPAGRRSERGASSSRAAGPDRAARDRPDRGERRGKAVPAGAAGGAVGDEQNRALADQSRSAAVAAIRSTGDGFGRSAASRVRASGTGMAG